MRRALRKIAILMLTVVLATVLAPSFAWESAGGSGHGHDNDFAVLDKVNDVYNHDSHANSHDSGEDASYHHGCAGHLLGHLPGHLSEAFVFIALDTDRDSFSEPAAAFPFSFPNRLDRPPRTLTLA